MNKVELIGNLGCDVETRYSQSGTQVASFRVATTERWEKNGEKHEATEWHRIVAFGKAAKLCEAFKKGSFVRLTGSNKTRKWTTPEGQDKYVTEVQIYKAELMKKREE
jgi:single-strand DNA-binding protein